MLAQQYWNDIGAKKVFEDPLYLDKLSQFLSPNAQIIEYGCGYGRMMRILKSAGYHNLIGFDFAPNMITRGLSGLKMTCTTEREKQSQTSRQPCQPLNQT